MESVRSSGGAPAGLTAPSAPWRCSMHSETDWLTKTDGGEGVADAYKFFMRPDPDMRDFLGSIETVDDELTGRPMRTRRAKVAMLRGADASQEVTVYLDPLPHIRLEKAKPLQGWYQSLHN